VTARRLLVALGALSACVGWALAAVFLWETRVPADLRLPRLDVSDYFTAEQLEKTASFERFLLIDYLLAAVAEIVALAVLAWRAPGFARTLGLGPVGAGIIVGMVTIAVAWAVGLPFALAEQWWLRRHGLSEEGYLEWIFTPWAQVLAQAASALVLIAVSMALARRIGRLWWLAGAPVFVAIAAALAFALPYLVKFDTEPVRDPVLAADARRLERATGAGATEVRVAIVSDYTSLANAQTMGMGPSESVVLWDTLLDGRFEDDEVRFVLAHELAHAARDHIWKSLAWFALLAFPLALAVAEVTRRRGGLGLPENVPLAALVLAVLALVLAPVSNTITRHYEAEADWIALEATADPDGARGLFEEFADADLEDPTPPAWAQQLFGTHPTVLDRIAMAEAWSRRGP
jgi:STE24 endopeptidase